MNVLLVVTSINEYWVCIYRVKYYIKDCIYPYRISLSLLLRYVVCSILSCWLIQYEKNEKIWFSPMTKALTSTENTRLIQHQLFAYYAYTTQWAFFSFCNSRFSLLAARVSPCTWNQPWHTPRYRQFGGHKNRENKSLKIEFNFILVCKWLFWVFIHIRLTIQRNRIFAPLDKKLFIYLMQNFRSFTYLVLRGA